jgi:ABC-type branched-subunit amino acid transport system substrate-binding protein
MTLDDESVSTKGVQNARRHVIQDKVDVLVGSSLTPVTMPALDIALESKTPLLSLAAPLFRTHARTGDVTRPRSFQWPSTPPR